MSEKAKESKFNFKNFDEYREWLDAAPNKDWLQTRSLGGSKSHSFIPVFIQNANSDFMFREWYVIDEKYIPIQNGVLCIVKIQALPDYPDAEHIIFTGSAGIPFKDVKNAVEFDVPNSRERAIAKAFATLGNVFGRNLNRKYKYNNKTIVVQSDFSFLNKKSDE